MTVLNLNNAVVVSGTNAINFPRGLNKPQQNSFSRVIEEGFILNDIQSGQPFFKIESDDLPVTYGLEFIYSQAESSALAAWLRKYKEVLNGAYFGMQIYTESGFTEKSVKFIEGGTPQLRRVQSLYNVYNCTVQERPQKTKEAEPVINTVIAQGGIASV